MQKPIKHIKSKTDGFTGPDLKGKNGHLQQKHKV